MIELQSVSFDYSESKKGGVHDLSLKIERGECVLLCGASGCGKTTLTRLVNGLIPHFFEGRLSGKILVDGMNTSETDITALSDKVGCVFQNPRTQFFNTDTDSEIVFGLENRGVVREKLIGRLDEITKELRLGTLRGRSIFELSGGEKQKIAFSSVYAADPDILVFDEPSSNLDMRSIFELSGLIENAKKAGKTVLIAEHRIWYLMNIADRVIYMKDGSVEADMPMAAFKALTERDTAAMGLRIRSLSKAKLCNEQVSGSKDLLSAENMSVRLGGRYVLKNLSFNISAGEIVAVAGANGAGKTTLARALCGLQKEAEGRILWNKQPLNGRKRKEKAYMVMQDVGHQLFTESVMAECLLGIKNPDTEKIEAALKLVSLSEYKDRHPLSLSGGQMQRLAVAVSEICGKELLVFDEPTSGLDLKSMVEVGSLTRQLAEQGKILLIITHDIEFMKMICTRILFIKDGRIARDLAGGKKEEIIELLRGEA